VGFTSSTNLSRGRRARDGRTRRGERAAAMKRKNAMEDRPTDASSSSLRVCEMYCGVGVMHEALRRARPRATVCEAYDLNPNACDVYEVNWGQRPSQKNLTSVPARALEKLRADVWAMSPPCQPFTRQGLKLDVDDGRAESFMRLVDKMAKMEANVRPKYVFVENVVGFETSRMRDVLREALSSMAFHMQEFILTPTMFGVPYSRPRYFMCARTTRAFADAVDEIRRAPPPSVLANRAEWIPNFDEANDASTSAATLTRFLDDDDETWRDHAVKQEDVDKSKGAIDIVSGEDVTCNCFTKSYGKYIKGTGSVVANRRVDKSVWDGRVGDTDDGVRLRYFTVREVTRLHSLPDDFKWPESLTKRQKYHLLGNSMSAACVAPLFDYLFSDDVGR